MLVRSSLFAMALMAMSLAAPPPASAHAQDRNEVNAVQVPPQVGLSLVQLASDTTYDIAGACVIGVVQDDIAQVVHLSLGQACRSNASIGRITRVESTASKPLARMCTPSDLDLSVFIRSGRPVHAFLCDGTFVVLSRTSDLLSRFGSGSGRTS